VSAGSWLEQFILAVVLLLSLAFVLRRAVRVFSAKKEGGCNCSNQSCCSAKETTPQAEDDTHSKKSRYIPITVIDNKRS